MGERKIEQKQIQFYLMEKPLSISVLHILITQPEGLTVPNWLINCICQYLLYTDSHWKCII